MHRTYKQWTVGLKIVVAAAAVVVVVVVVVAVAVESLFVIWIRKQLQLHFECFLLNSEYD